MKSYLADMTWTWDEGFVEGLEVRVGDDGRIAAVGRDLESAGGEVVRLPLDPPLYVAGVDDPGRGQNWTKRNLHIEELEALGRDLPEDGPVLLLVHRPEAFPQAARVGFPLVLAGHTHGGQVVFPFVGAPRVPSRYGQKYLHGLVKTPHTQVFITRGLGTVTPPLRFCCRPEITLITIT